MPKRVQLIVQVARHGHAFRNVAQHVLRVNKDDD